MLFSNVMKTLILIAIFVAIPAMLYRLSVKGLAQLSQLYRDRSSHCPGKVKGR